MAKRQIYGKDGRRYNAVGQPATGSVENFLVHEMGLRDPVMQAPYEEKLGLVNRERYVAFLKSTQKIVDAPLDREKDQRRLELLISSFPELFNQGRGTETIGKYPGDVWRNFNYVLAYAREILGTTQH